MKFGRTQSLKSGKERVSLNKTHSNQSDKNTLAMLEQHNSVAS